jgi:RHS repeat-associated protein
MFVEYCSKRAETPGVFATADYGSFTLDLMGGEDRYRHFDFRRNVKLVTDEMGAVVTHYRYAGYGIDEVHGEPGDGTSFVGGRELGGLLLLGMRVLDPLAGRFLSPDPIYQVANQFAYADANPVEFWDPAGTVSISATVGGNAGLDFGIVSFGVVARARRPTVPAFPGRSPMPISRERGCQQGGCRFDVQLRNQPGARRPLSPLAARPARLISKAGGRA